MIRKTLLFIVLSILSITIYGQVTEFYINAEAYAVIRSLNNNTNLILTEDDLGNDVFILHSDNQPMAQAFRLPWGVKVHDVRIWDNEYRGAF